MPLFSPSWIPKSAARLLLLLLLGVGGRALAPAEEPISVSGKVESGYTRTKRADGSFAPETYVFKEGGFLSSRLADPTIDTMTFASVARVMANALAGQNYVRSADPHRAKLLIVLYWGTSRAPAEINESASAGMRGEATNIVDRAPEINKRGVVHFRSEWQEGYPQAFQDSDQMVMEEDAMMLGYPSVFDPDLKHYRYFVVLLAYDLDSLRTKGKRRLLWQARFSMREQFHGFDRSLPRLAAAAAPFFGQDSGGLRRQAVPEGKVEIGPLSTVGEAEDPSMPAALSPDGRRVAYLETGTAGSVVQVVDLGAMAILSADAVPNPRDRVLKLSWGPGGTLLATEDGYAVLSVDAKGNRVHAEMPPFEAPPPPPIPADLKAAVEGKFPDRKVALLGQDQAGDRQLLAATTGSGETRYFVYDAADDLLYEVGRAVGNP